MTPWPVGCGAPPATKAATTSGSTRPAPDGHPFLACLGLPFKPPLVWHENGARLIVLRKHGVLARVVGGIDKAAQLAAPGADGSGALLGCIVHDTNRTCGTFCTCNSGTSSGSTRPQPSGTPWPGRSGAPGWCSTMACGYDGRRARMVGHTCWTANC